MCRFIVFGFVSGLFRGLKRHKKAGKGLNWRKLATYSPLLWKVQNPFEKLVQAGDDGYSLAVVNACFLFLKINARLTSTTAATATVAPIQTASV